MDYHTDHAWQTHLSDKRSATLDIKDFYSKLVQIRQATSEEHMNFALRKLTESEEWKKKISLQKWFKHHYIQRIKVF